MDEAIAWTAGDALVRRLAEHGIDYIFGNAGTDHPPVIEALSKAATHGTPAPFALAIPHENLAVGMAYGHAMISGRPQAVMVHVSVGTSNTICGLLNATRDRVPILILAGRTPYSESGHRGSRSIYSHWGQEMFDQAGMLREIVKWDYELRLADQVEPVLDRAMALMMSDPRRPVYLTLPREVLAADRPEADARPRLAREQTAEPSRSAIRQAADWLAEAERPLIITSAVGADLEGPAALSKMANKWAVPVISHIPKRLCLPTTDPMHMGYDPDPFLADADLVLVVDCDVPWIPDRTAPPASARIIHLGFDPLYSRYPMRTFPADLMIGGRTTSGMEQLAQNLDDRAQSGDDAWKALENRVATRRQAIAVRRQTWRQAEDAAAAKLASDMPLDPVVVTRAIDVVKGEDAIVISELGVMVEHLTLTKPGTFFSASPAGGLGWGLGAALGAKLAAPNRLVIASVGDGSYMFGNPTPAHFVSHAHDIPILVIVFNNASWTAVIKSTEAMYPGGYSSRVNRMPLTHLQPSPAFERVIEASGGYGERVETPEQLKAALGRAIHAVTVERRQALLNVICRIPETRAF